VRGRCRLVRHQFLTAASERANRLLAVVCRTTSLTFRDFPHEWVKLPPPGLTQRVIEVLEQSVPDNVSPRGTTTGLLEVFDVVDERLNG
jgi:hypothetical protein